MTTSASGASRNTSPPSTPEAEIVPTIRIRPEVKVKLMAGPPDGMKSDSIYIRRFWVAAIGPGAVADLLRTIRAGQRKQTVTYPIYLHVLVQSGLAAFDGARVTVPHPVPLLPPHLVRRLPPALRREHAIWLRLRNRAS
jgi:hypothetical protein